MSESKNAQVVDLMAALKASLAATEPPTPRHQNVAEPFRSVLEGIAPPAGRDKAETSAEIRTREAIEEIHSRHPPREPRKSENPTRETAEQITIRVLKAEVRSLAETLGSAALTLRSENCGMTARVCEEKADAALTLLARLEMTA